MEKKTKDLLVIMPAHNEEENIGKVLEHMENTKITDVADILVINDGSSDQTSWIVHDYGYAVVTHVFNLGYGAALQSGYKYAIRRNYKYVVQMDSDGQHDPCNILKIYQELQTKDEDGNYPDIVLGSRFLEGGESFRISWMKKIAFVMFRRLIRLATRQKFTDPTTGLQGLNRDAVLYYSKYSHFDEKFPDANMIIQMLLLGYRVREIPAVMHIRETGTSMHSGLKPILYMAHMFFSICAIWLRIGVMKKGIKTKSKTK